MRASVHSAVTTTLPCADVTGMVRDRRLEELVDRLVADFPDHSREHVERIATSAWVVFGAAAGDVAGRVRVAEWYVRRELAGADE